ncbi:MAG: TrkH family potassium uptake protein [bacterium]|nr:TrkH family potassium uptake protein [bacterium]
MNPRRVIRLLGIVIGVLAVAQLLPLIGALATRDRAAAGGLAAGAGASALCALACRLYGRDDGELYRRDGILVVVGAWLVACVLGAVPYVVSGAIPGWIDALFESASGFTTTGASILPDVEVLTPSIAFWRSMTQWLGGIGIVVLLVALLSELGPGARFLLKLEVPGPKAEILHARVKDAARSAFRIYLALSGAQVVVMLLLGASVYDSLTHTFATVSTGGFSPYADSAGHFDARFQIVTLVFMLMAGVNFSLYLRGLTQRGREVLRDAELQTYLTLAVGATATILFVRLGASPDLGAGQAALDVAFSVVSVLTSTGFGTADFTTWPSSTQAILVALMFGGGCAGSTAGGAKVIRLLVAARFAIREIRVTFSPNAVVPVAVGAQIVPEGAVRGVVALLLLWVSGWAIGALLLSFGGTGLVNASTAALAALSNIGPGLGDVGPAGNFAFFAGWQKLVLVLLMWLGRLEFFALIALAQPRFWRS